MPKVDSSVIPLVLAALVAAGVGVAVAFEPWQLLKKNAEVASTASKGAGTAPASNGATADKAPAKAASPVIWVASAPGRVEPKGGEVRIGPQSAGRIVQVAVRMNDQVKAGDVLVRLDDTDLFIRHAAIETEAAVRRRERDLETVQRPSLDRRQAEDAVAAAERAAFQARLELDAQTDARRSGKADADVAKAQEALTAARDKLEQERAALRRVQAQAGMPLPTRLEAALAGSRSELSLAEQAIERMRIRAPSDSTVLQINAKVGETVAPASELPLAVLGDVSSLQVKAELEERDVAKIRLGQRAVVRSDAYPGKEFDGRVSQLAQSLAAPRLASRGPRRPSDVDVLEVVVSIDGQSPLLPGMRVDVFFRPDATVQSGAIDRASAEAGRTN